MIATQELIAAALRLAALAERNTDDRDEWQHAIDSVREACAGKGRQMSNESPLARGPVDVLVGRLRAHAEAHEYIANADPEQKQWMNDLYDAADAIERAPRWRDVPDLLDRISAAHDASLDETCRGLLRECLASLILTSTAPSAPEIVNVVCPHGVRAPHECKACADSVSDADVAAWMARAALRGEVK